ncbi:hypothetical protein HK096_001659, partial [Nowakowskiella sp. JEL0078]
MKFTSFEQLPDLSSKVAIITGGNAGLGFQTAKALAFKGASIFITGRSEPKLKAAVIQIQDDAKKANISLDNSKIRYLQSLPTVENLARTFLALNLPLHILVNNASVVSQPGTKLPEIGYELSMITNHFAHVYLTLLLLDAIRKAEPGARIVNVSSDLHHSVKKSKFDWEKLARTQFIGMYGYSESKLMNILFTHALVKRLEGSATQPEIGALSSINAVASPDIEKLGLSGKYIGPKLFLNALKPSQVEICKESPLVTKENIET